jgi:hypothetical protein
VIPFTPTENVTCEWEDRVTLRDPVRGVTLVTVGLTGAGAMTGTGLGAGLGAELAFGSGGTRPGLGLAFGSGLGLGLALGAGLALGEGPGLAFGSGLGLAVGDVGLEFGIDDGLGLGLGTGAGLDCAAARATAAPTWSRPKPESGFCPPLESGLAVCSRSSFTASTPIEGLTARMRATEAVTCGVAIEVPDQAS